jgi:hypothetical protein
MREKKRDRQFVAANDIRLRESIDQFAAFTSSNGSRSLISILRAAYSQNMQSVEQIIVGDCIGSWMHCYREQLTFPTQSLPQFLSQCREFGSILQAFNSNYVVRAQRHLATTIPLADHYIEQLEGFREEYRASQLPSRLLKN